MRAAFCWRRQANIRNAVTSLWRFYVRDGTPRDMSFRLAKTHFFPIFNDDEWGQRDKQKQKKHQKLIAEIHLPILFVWVGQ